MMHAESDHNMIYQVAQSCLHMHHILSAKGTVHTNQDQTNTKVTLKPYMQPPRLRGLFIAGTMFLLIALVASSPTLDSQSNYGPHQTD